MTARKAELLTWVCITVKIIIKKSGVKHHKWLFSKKRDISVNSVGINNSFHFVGRIIVAFHLSFFNGSREDCAIPSKYTRSNIKFSLEIRKHAGLFIANFYILFLFSLFSANIGVKLTAQGDVCCDIESHSCI